MAFLTYKMSGREEQNDDESDPHAGSAEELGGIDRLYYAKYGLAGGVRWFAHR